MSLGIRKTGKVSHLCKLLTNAGINFNPKDIEELSTSQLRKRIQEIKGHATYKWRAGDNLPTSGEKC